MLYKHFNKDPLKTINTDEVVAHGTFISSYLENIKIYDIISKSIGVLIEGGRINYIIMKGTSIPLRDNLLEYK